MNILLIVIFISILFIYYKFPYPTKVDDKKHYDVACVLGCPTNADGSLSTFQKKRMDCAIKLYHAKITKKILISGSNVQNEYYEANTMATYARTCKVKEEDLILEFKARNTYENLKYAKQIYEEAKMTSLIVITSPFHMRRANFFVHKFFQNYAMATYPEHPTIKELIEEYFRMWNTLYYEVKLKHKK